MEAWDLYFKKFEARQTDGSIREEQNPELMSNCIEKKLLRSIKRYEMKVTDDTFTEAALEAHLKSKLSNFAPQVELESILGKLRFDPHQREPEEKVRKVFEHVVTYSPIQLGRQIQRQED